MHKQQPESNLHAAIDLGTNTFLLLIAEIKDGDLKPVYQQAKIIRLGRDVDKSRHLSEAAMGRAHDCLAHFSRVAQEFNAITVTACGTSALRDAENRDVFIKRIADETGIRIEVISGEEEARLSYLGAISNQKGLSSQTMIIDIGGGSTEICQGTVEKMQERISLDIGSVRLTERYIFSDPIQASEIAQMKTEIDRHLENLPAIAAIDQELSVIGVAGTITTLAAIDHKIDPWNSERIDTIRLHADKVEKLAGQLAGMTLAARKELAGLAPKRADVIVAGAFILSAIMRKLNIEKLRVSDRGLRFGILLDNKHID